MEWIDLARVIISILNSQGERQIVRKYRQVPNSEKKKGLHKVHMNDSILTGTWNFN